jgi:hypothetical protein
MAPKKKLGTGARPDPPDARDFRMTFDAAIAPPVDWASGSGLPRPTLVDQNGSDACVAHALSYYHWQLRNKEFSRRDLFARIANAGEGDGADIRKGMDAISGQGQALEADLPDPPIEDCTNMRDKTGITGANELPWKEFSYVKPDNDIESVARYISLYRGCVMGLYGTNLGWQNGSSPVPNPPTDDQMADLTNMIKRGIVFQHALYFVDFHMHVETDGSQHNCIVGVTSWPSRGATEHHIREPYFTAGATFNPWSFVPSATVATMMQGAQLTIPGKAIMAAAQVPTKRAKKAAHKKLVKRARRTRKLQRTSRLSWRKMLDTSLE